MERIKLSRNEKKVLRLVASGKDCLDGLSEDEFTCYVRSLEGKGLVRCAYIEGGGVESAILILHGKAYIAQHPGIMDSRPLWKKICRIKE